MLAGPVDFNLEKSPVNFELAFIVKIEPRFGRPEKEGTATFTAMKVERGGTESRECDATDYGADNDGSVVSSTWRVLSSYGN